MGSARILFVNDNQGVHQIDEILGALRRDHSVGRFSDVDEHAAQHGAVLGVEAVEGFVGKQYILARCEGGNGNKRLALAQAELFDRGVSGEVEEGLRVGCVGLIPAGV